jgi:hypothetical protein
VGNKASNGAISADVDRNTDASNLTNQSSTSGTSDMNSSSGMRAARADRG